ncbi:uncharacterized protein CPUR_01740 [Claviceps purpurea 20.1]|uniref:Uncharacterized protein n=1 Tax=Claviceps purpurea (strain 20.1) TaxID=1111077 RepID=M1VZL8_CLAP2|nr:uncharacterized protein CPUR_01740 [Claviceps purpurea 20.1]
MSERDLLLKELQETRRRARADREQERLRAALKEHEHLFGPLTVKEYVEECHTLDGKLDVVTKLTLITEGPVVDPGDRPRPRLIVQWKGFPQKQQEILNKLPSDHKLPPDQGFPTRVDLRMICGGSTRRILKPIESDSSEYSLAMNREEAVIGPVELLMKEILRQRCFCH